MPGRLIESLATTEALAELFSDPSVFGAMVDFEVALARAEADLKIIPQPAARAIAAATNAGFEDEVERRIIQDSLRAATPGVPFVKAFTALVKKSDSRSAGFVHWGATSQDLCDTALVLLLKKAQPILKADVERLQEALRHLAVEHQHSVMPGRTLLRAAPPTTFGLKAAGWLAAIHRSWERVRAGFRDSTILQFGGASGTLAALGERGIDVGKALAEELGLGYPEAPWHAHRDRLATLVCSCGVLCGTLGKMALDIGLLTQDEIGEAAEPRDYGRGGSSTMPHKHNPAGCGVTLAAANRVPGLVASFLSAMAQEQERALGGWQSEWPVIAGVIQATGVAAASMAEVAEGLALDPQRMRANIEKTRGAIFGERAVMLLAEKFGRDAAQEIVGTATRRSAERKTRLAEVLGEMEEVHGLIDADTLHDLEIPEKYLGAADEFRKRLLASAKGSARQISSVFRRRKKQSAVSNQQSEPEQESTSTTETRRHGENQES